MNYDFTLADLFKAYFDCRKNKRCKLTALKFEINLEKNLLDLYKEIKSGNYKIGRSICFVVTHPKPREVWAANFRDRIVHHLIYNFISERFYKRFIKDTYSCIPKRGTLAAAKRLLHFSRSATNNYTKEMYYLKADMSNFFVSINKNILFELLKKYVHEEWILAILKKIIYNDPTKNVLKKSSRKKFRLIPSYKSLFNSDCCHGLPIGNLTSQFFSNVYLDVLDQYIKHNLKCRYYVRYVDDFIIIAENPHILNSLFDKIRSFLYESLNVTLHPKKKLVNKLTVGMDFVGFIVKPARMLLRQNILRRIFEIIKIWKNAHNMFEYFILNKFFRTINSYLGMLINVSSFNIRLKIALLVNSLFIRPDFSFSKVVLCY
ncbi:reverse transcriptase [bacterium]|nr:reverse transcriptase [bacterium]